MRPKFFRVIELLKTYGHTVLETHIKHIDRKIWEIKIDKYRVLYFYMKISIIFWSGHL